MKKLIFLLLSLVLILSLAACGAGNSDDSRITQGTGTESDPYLIGTAGQLRNMASLVKNDDSKAAACYKLTADIDLGGKDWTPVGSDGRKFSGTFDGAGFTVRNFKINESNSLDVGFFGVVSGTVQNLTLAGADIRATHDSAAVGAVVGTLWGGTLENCHTAADVTVTSEYQAGGICGDSRDGTTLRGCTNAATVNAGSTIGEAAGIVVIARCTVENCTNSGAITAASHAAGIACTMNAGAVDCANSGAVTAGRYAAGIACNFGDGALNHNENAEVEMVRCTNSGTITSEDDNAAGIVVCCRSGTLRDCANSGAVTGGQLVGGIFSFFQISSFGAPSECFTVSGCVNSGAITGRNDGLYATGGIGSTVYESDTLIVIENCVNSGTVTSGQDAGGILGQGTFREIRITGCRNEGKILGIRIAGGILGRAYPHREGETLLTIENCSNTGAVHAGHTDALYDGYFCGGILGHCDRVTLTDTPFTQVQITGCENSGDLTTDGQNAELFVHDLCGTWAGENP